MSCRKLKIICLILFTFISYIKSEEIQPGLRVAINDRAIFAFEEHFIPLFLQNLTNIPLNNSELTTHIDFLGNIKVSLQNMKIIVGTINPSQIQVLFNNNNTISVLLEQLSMNLEFDYTITTNFYNNKGKGTAGFKNLSFILENRLFAIDNENSRRLYNRTVLGPAINIENLYLTSLVVDIKFDNNQPLESLITFLVDNVNQIFQKQIKDILNDSVIPQANVYLNETCRNFDLVGRLPGDINVDYSLIESPRIINNSLEVSFNATLFSDNNVFFVNTSSQIPHVSSFSKQIEILLNQYVIDSLLITLQNTDKLNFYISGTSMNSTGPLSLNTGSIGLFISGLTDKYGNNKTMDLKCNSTKVPSISLGNNKASGMFYPECDFIVNVNSTYNETAFTVDLNLNGDVKVYLQKGYLKGEITSLSIDSLKVVKTAIGTIEENKLKNFFNFAFGIGLPIINSIVFKDNGIILPSIQGISFKDTDLTIKSGYIQLDMNPLFEQSKKRIRYLR